MSAGADTPIARLVRRIDLPAVAEDRFAAAAGRSRGRLFGGLVAAQSVVAAGRSVAAGELHSLHAWFLRAGSGDRPIDYRVERIRDGRRFSSRRVVAEQDARPIFEMLASFSRKSEGVSHQDPAPALPPPEELEDWEEVRGRLVAMPRRRGGAEAFDVRVVEPERDAPLARSAPSRAIWMRARGELPSDPLLRAALLVYASDRALLRCAGRPHALEWSAHPPASLDHAVWLHGAPQISDWFAYDCHSPAAHAGRGLAIGAMYTRAGERFATVAQEGLLET